MARILKPGGEIVISDGNNLAHLPTRLNLIEMYECWENGPHSKELGTSCYRNQREGIIRRKFPDLDEEKARYVAANTSGLWGDALVATVDGYLRGNGFVERPYRPGICPTRPLTGVMMERGFFPEEVERALVLQGIDAMQIYRGKAIAGPGERGRSKNFTIRGTKLAEDIPTLLAFAKADHARHYELAARPETANGAARTAVPVVRTKKPKAQKLLKKVLRRISGRA